MASLQQGLMDWKGGREGQSVQRRGQSAEGGKEGRCFIMVNMRSRVCNMPSLQDF